MALPPFAVDQLSRLLAYLPVSSDTDSLDRKRKRCRKRLTFLKRFRQVSPPLDPADYSDHFHIKGKNHRHVRKLYYQLPRLASFDARSLAPSRRSGLPRVLNLGAHKVTVALPDISASPLSPPHCYWRFDGPWNLHCADHIEARPALPGEDRIFEKSDYDRSYRS